MTRQHDYALAAFVTEHHSAVYDIISGYKSYIYYLMKHMLRTDQEK